MAKIYLKYNPYKMETQISVNGKEIISDSSLYKVVKGKRLQEWVGEFPLMLIEELNTVDFDIDFYGLPLDWDDFEDVFNRAKAEGTIKSLRMNFIEGRSDEDVNDKIVNVFNDLQHGPIDDFRDPKLARAFSNINTSIFPINVIATMSSGKSTLINALLGKKLMPTKNEACTAKITEILDNDIETFTAVLQDENDQVIYEISDLTYEIMSEVNDNEKVHRISAEGNIPFLDAKSTALMLVDTPGPNNSQNQEHKNTTYRAINSDSNNLILYVLNATQLKTNDDAALLSYVADQIKKGGKQVRDRFLFVINKMDGFNPEEEDIGKAIIAAKRYLASYGIEDPQIFPCSAYTALNIRTCLEGIDIDNMTRADERKLPSSARDTLPMIDKLIDYPSMHLEQYSTLSPSAQRELNYKLSEAEKNGDTKEQALIHCGIYSIEAAISAYVKKYAKTKKVKDLVESFQEVLESTQVLAKAKTQVATNEDAAKACLERAMVIKSKIANGKEAEIFKEKISQLDPMPTLTEKAEAFKVKAINKTGIIFEQCGMVITNKLQAEMLVSNFARMSSLCIAELTAELESAIDQEVMKAGEKIITDYQEKLSKIDESSTNKQLDFETIDLIKGSLKNMRENAEACCSNDFVAATIDDVGEVTYEEKVYYEKVGQEEEEVVDGTEEVKIGTKKRTVRNQNKRWWKLFTPSYVEEEYDVYETVVKYKTVMRDIFEERRELIENFSVETRVIQSVLISEIRRNLDEGIEKALIHTDEQIGDMKRQFTVIFEKLDRLIQEKYSELEKCATDQKTKEVELEKSKNLLAWIEACKEEINGIINI